MSKRKAVSLLVAAVASMTAIPLAQAQATSFTGNVVWLETWKSGNAAFTLTASGVPCNGQFILNKSDPGFKNLYAMVIAAKLVDRPIRVYVGNCISAEGGSANYAEVLYLYYD
jgi:hypothetical protein